MAPTEVVQIHLRCGMSTFQTTGSCPTILWAVGDEQTAFATPAVSGAEDDAQTVLAMLARIVEAWMIGRTDEAWAKQSRSVDDLSRVRFTHLAHLTEIDPEVRTAIVVRSVEVDSHQEWIGFATVRLDDHGQATFDEFVPEPLELDHQSDLASTARLLALSGTMLFDRQDFILLSRQTLEEWGWAITIQAT